MNPRRFRTNRMSGSNGGGAGAPAPPPPSIVPASTASSPRFHPLAFLLLSAAVLVALLAPPAAAYTELSDDQLSSIPEIGASDFDIVQADDNDRGKSLLAPLLIPRVPGTPGQEAAQAHLASFFRDQLPRWSLSWQNSTSTTPATGDRQIPFANLLLRRDPPSRRRDDHDDDDDADGSAAAHTAYLTLAAHYDSKLKPDGFIGATDSAAPCAMIMHVARTIEGYLARKWREDEDEEQGGKGQRDDGDGGDAGVPGEWGDVGVQILLLDGEEAFVTWSATDSLYGARSLAEEWESTVNPAMSTYRNPLGQISLFVLLDLLGSAGGSVPSYFLTTHWAYRAMAQAEERLRGLGLLEADVEANAAAAGSGSGSSGKGGNGMFLRDAAKKSSEFRRSGVEDDHIPFLQRGVPILHLIASPFPRVWHTRDDDGEHLDLPTVRDWARIVTAFALEWLDVGVGVGGDGGKVEEAEVGVTPPQTGDTGAG